jgi:uncharacterized protein YuzE
MRKLQRHHLSNHKKPRIAQIDITLEANDSVELKWHEEKQIASIMIHRAGKIVSAHSLQLTTYYEREKKPKFINSIPFRKSSEFTFDQADTLALYDQVWAVDTNSKSAFGCTVNVTALSVVATDRSEAILPFGLILFGKTKGIAELFGWRQFIKLAMSHSQYHESHRYGLIVDADLPNIKRYNNRTLPIHEDFFLPNNFELIYATADKGGDSIFNRALKRSDNLAKLALTSIIRLEKNAKYFLDIDDEAKHEIAFVHVSLDKG